MASGEGRLEYDLKDDSMVRIPWLVTGVLVGTLFMQVWPGQTEWGFALELLRCCGGGFIVGLVLDSLIHRWEQSPVTKKNPVRNRSRARRDTT